MIKNPAARLFLNKRYANGVTFLFLIVIVSVTLVSCVSETPVDSGDTSTSSSYNLPTEGGEWKPSVSHEGSLPAGMGMIRIEIIGEFVFDSSEVETLRPDIFQPGHFSLFDIVVHLADRGDIDLDYHFDESMDTHVIDTINGMGEWWYEAYYSNGWREPNAFRMDMYPYKDNTYIRLFQEQSERLVSINHAFQEEVARLSHNSGIVIIPDVVIESPGSVRTFQDVEVTAHDLRDDVLHPGVVTAMDVVLSLAEQGELSRLKLTWYESIVTAEPVDSYWLEQIDEAEAYGSCGFVYEVGARRFSGFTGSHIHIPSDVRVIVSPEYGLWFWICL
ncbi:MAG: hypothetical protein SVO26_01760 [Chloroflexota bacterium]|nr:hypothetical protein [Chloroflexota bacterium]